MKNDREVMQALIDGKKLKVNDEIIRLDEHGDFVNQNGKFVGFIYSSCDYSVYEESKPKKKYVMYRHWFLSSGELVSRHSNLKWDQMLYDVDSKFVETEIIKEIEV